MATPDRARQVTPWTAAQLAAGVVAAQHRGDAAGAEALLETFPDESSKVRGFHVLAEVALSLVRHATGQDMDELLRELSVYIAQADDAVPPHTRGETD